jgi:hypothetical protein
MKKPNLFISGFPKSGTSSLYDYIGQHPDVFASERKEPHTYTIEKRFNQRYSVTENPNFLDFYKKSTGERYIMDGSTTTMISKDALYRIKMDTPDAKIIIMARDPIERIFSHYNWINSMGVTTYNFRKEILIWNKFKFNPEIYFKGCYKNYIEFSKYGEQIQRCYETFPQNQVLVLFFENLKSDPKKVLSKIFNFLQIPDFPIKYQIINPTRSIKIIQEKKTMIRDFAYKVKRNYPTLYSRTIIHLERMRINKVKPGENEIKFLFSFLKKDLQLLNTLGFYSNQWVTTEKIWNGNY